MLKAISFFALLLSLPTPPNAPDALKPPKDQVLLFHVKGRGRQIYVCQGSTWKFKAPEANLYYQNGKLLGRHFAGPTWEARDRSRVIGKLVASTPAPVPNAIPWLLLSSVFRDNKGVFSKVESIQRLETKGGVAPSAACTARNQKQETGVAYEASYYFYGKR